MPGSMTTPSQLDTRVYRAQPCCLALSIKRRHSGYVHFAAQWLAYVYPCQRFTSHLAVRHA